MLTDTREHLTHAESSYFSRPPSPPGKQRKIYLLLIQTISYSEATLLISLILFSIHPQRPGKTDTL